MRLSVFYISIFLLFLIYSCKKDSVPITYNPTTITLDIPAYVKSYVGDMPMPVDNPITVDGVALGRKLFYERMLSNDGSISCGTCHKQENAFDDPRPFSQGTNGTFGSRNAMAIINLGWNERFFWDGRRNALETQAHDPVTNPIEMANKWSEVVKRLQSSIVYTQLFYKAFGTTTIDSNLAMKAIAQFERTLVSFDSKFDKFYYGKDSSVFNLQELNGLHIFTGKGMCNNCHLMNTLFTDLEFSNNGLDETPEDFGLEKFTGQASDRGKFKVPTLRNIEVSAPYMHDSRFATLEEVVDHYSEHVHQNSPNIDAHMQAFGTGLHLSVQEKSDLVAFLKTLTDQNFIHNPSFGDPLN